MLDPNRPFEEGRVWLGESPQGLHEWCTRLAGAGSCNYVWAGMKGWHVTIRTTHGHEILRYGDAVVHYGDHLLGIVRKED